MDAEEDNTRTLTLLKKLSALPTAGTADEQKKSSAARKEIFIELKNVAVACLRENRPVPRLLAWFLAQKLEEGDKEFLLPVKKLPTEDARLIANPQMALFYESWKRKREENESGEFMAPSLDATSNEFGVSEETVKKANRLFGPMVRQLFPDAKEEPADPRLLRKFAPHRSPQSFAFPHDASERIDLPNGHTGFRLSTGDFMILDADGTFVFTSFQHR